MKRSWLSLSWTHARWMLRTTWRNGEQLLLVIGLPILAFLAITRTDLFPGSQEPIVVVVAMVVLAAGFTSPAISLAFDRRYGSYAFLGTTPLTRGGIVAGTLIAIGISTLLAVSLVALVATVFSEASPVVAWLVLATVTGLAALVPWAFVVGGTIRAEMVLVVANATFVVATLFGGVLIPADSLPYGAVLAWLPPGAIVAVADGSEPIAVAALLGWGAVGVLLARRSFRWR